MQTNKSKTFTEYDNLSCKQLNLNDANNQEVAYLDANQ